ncbi:hypothetical protein G7Z17_g9694 [Cylindrodendrum hubeiense]|uniref:Uncharacterized protein n=1 Tax=Cylindrodendrum hubeiense TaxID=595255 RepID=A0A9P5H0Y9_9HYPO|nr:hypothetical protein G7Z17_g9694 [Cylindrodendrum hubeiense]
MAILAFLVSCLVKKNRQDQDQDEDPRSFKTFMTKSKAAKKRKMSDADKEDDEDIQRQVMIRKSLASRASSRTTNRVSKGKAPQRDGDDDDDDDDDEDDEEQPVNNRKPNSLKTDWKAYEADLQRNRSVLIRRHPGVDRSAGGSSTTPLSPISATSPTSPTSLMSSTFSASPRPSPVPRQHTFPSITRKPVARTATTIPEYPASPIVGIAE